MKLGTEDPGLPLPTLPLQLIPSQARQTSAPHPHLTLGVQGVLALLILGHLVGLVLAALLAVGPAGLGDVHLAETGAALGACGHCPG